MPLGLVVFARMDSRRLPGKALRDLAGRPLLGRVLDRVRAIEPRLPIVLATSDRALDDPIAAFAAAENVSVFRGSADDVAARALACARHFGFDAIVRISGDSPFVDPAMIAAFVARFGATPGLDLVTNVMPRSFPPGASIEVIAATALGRVLAETTDAADREHVTRYVYRRPGGFQIVNIAAPDGRYAGVSLAVDTAEDVARTASIVERLGERVARAPLDEIVALARRWRADSTIEVAHGRA